MVYATCFEVELERDISKVLVLALFPEEFLCNNAYSVHSVLGIGKSLDAVIDRNIIVRQDYRDKLRLRSGSMHTCKHGVNYDMICCLFSIPQANNCGRRGLDKSIPARLRKSLKLAFDISSREVESSL
jgi:hypothetical protein